MTDSLQKYLAELLGTFTLVFIGTVGILAYTGEVGAKNVTVGFAFGLALLAGLYAFADVSGGHFNPGVSLAMFLDKRLEAAANDRATGSASWPARCWARSACSSRSTRTRWHGRRRCPARREREPRCSSSCWRRRSSSLVILHSSSAERHKGTALVAIPLTLVAAHLALIPFSGSSLNTARSFGPALIGSEWTDFWVYIVGPIGGAIIGWLVYAIIDRWEAKAAGPTASTGPARRLAGGSLRGSLRSARPGGARRGSRPRRAPPGWGTAEPPRQQGPARSRRRRADRRARPRSSGTNSGGPPTCVATTERPIGHRLEQRLAERLDEARLADDAGRRHVLLNLVVRNGAHEPDAAPAGERRP